jgi:hypothetical protein
MIVKIMSRGSSFKGLSAYLMHDPQAESDERVAWTHTFNLAHDHVPSAVDEMLWTARDAELLKQEAGIRAGGRATENTVKHLSLNWAPDENPSREHMIETADEFLRHMKWDEHQAVLIAHEDKAYAHVHVMLNTVHPETGLKLDDAFEQRRAQAWALGYEREQGRIYCEQRLLNPAEREDSPTRPAWMAFKEKENEFERDEKILHAQEAILLDEPQNSKDAEWKILKQLQREQREAFFADGKSEFSDLRRAIYSEVREEFRDRWAEFYAAEREGGDATALATLKAELIAEQKTVLETRRDEACAELRETRNGVYRELLDDQREIRLALRGRQEAGFDNALFLQQVEDRNAGKDVTRDFADAANVATARQNEEQDVTTAFTGGPRRQSAGMKSGADIGGGIATGLGFGLLGFLDSIGDAFTGSTPAPQPRQREPEPSGPDPFEAVIDEARNREQRERDDADAEWRKRQGYLSGE